MGKRDPRFDAYIAKSSDFAKPILERLQKIVHEGCFELVEETRTRRLDQSVKRMAEGKGRNWKYEA